MYNLADMQGYIKFTKAGSKEQPGNLRDKSPVSNKTSSPVQHVTTTTPKNRPIVVVSSSHRSSSSCVFQRRRMQQNCHLCKVIIFCLSIYLVGMATMPSPLILPNSGAMIPSTSASLFNNLVPRPAPSSWLQLATGRSASSP